MLSPSSDRLPDPTQPFPSPGSAFVPPPVPGPHEFALPRKMSKTDSTASPLPDPPHDPQLVTSLTSSRPAPPSPAISRRASGLSRPPSGITPSSRPVSTFIQSTPATPMLSHDRRPNPPDLPEPAPTQPTSSSTPTLAPIRIRDYGFASTDPRFSGQGPHAPRPNRPAVLARRLAPSSDSTLTSSSEDDDCDDEGEEEKTTLDIAQRLWQNADVEDGTNGWNGFKWGFGRAVAFGRMSGLVSAPNTSSFGAAFPSRGDLDRNFGGEQDHEDMVIDEDAAAVLDEDDEGDGDIDAEGELPLFPGLYRALYAFEPEGTAETKLDEDQLVRVVGRGGGVGWAVVVKDGLKDTGLHALVPESYLEPVRLDREEDV